MALLNDKGQTMIESDLSKIIDDPMYDPATGNLVGLEIRPIGYSAHQKIQKEKAGKLAQINWEVKRKKLSHLAIMGID